MYNILYVLIFFIYVFIEVIKKLISSSPLHTCNTFHNTTDTEITTIENNINKELIFKTNGLKREQFIN